MQQQQRRRHRCVFFPHRSCLHSHPATHFVIETSARVGTVLRVESREKSFICYCDTADKTQAWAQELNAALSECRAASPDRHSESTAAVSPRLESVPRPVWVADAAVQGCQLCDREWSVKNRRHHCRIW